jgi:hypothetical protein
MPAVEHTVGELLALVTQSTVLYVVGWPRRLARGALTVTEVEDPGHDGYVLLHADDERQPFCWDDLTAGSPALNPGAALRLRFEGSECEVASLTKQGDKVVLSAG